MLDPDRWAHRIDKLVKRGLRRTKAGPRLEAALAERIREQAEAAHANGGVEMYFMNRTSGTRHPRRRDVGARPAHVLAASARRLRTTISHTSSTAEASVEAMPTAHSQG